MDSKLKKVARAGYAIKGGVYALTGILTFLAAVNLGGQKAGKLQVIKYLDKQPFGNALLVIVALGLACYATWRFIQSFGDPEGIGSDKKAIVKRIAYFISGCIYLGLAVFSVLQLFGSESSSGSSSDHKSQFLATSTGLIVLVIIGAIIVATGIYQFVRVYKQEYTKKFDLKSMQEEKRRKTIKNTANFGLSARGVIFIIIGFSAIKAGISSNPSQIKSASQAFSFLEKSAYGAWLMGIVALGLIGYGIYMFMMAKHRKFKDGNFN